LLLRGMNTAASIPSTTMTTISSTSVNPWFRNRYSICPDEAVAGESVAAARRPQQHKGQDRITEPALFLDCATALAAYAARPQAAGLCPGANALSSRW